MSTTYICRLSFIYRQIYDSLAVFGQAFRLYWAGAKCADLQVLAKCQQSRVRDNRGAAN
jgi:hypothetical protein